jgi:hypothetical protein
MIGCWIVQWQIWDYNWQSLIQISFMCLQIKVLSTRKHPRKQDTVFLFPTNYPYTLQLGWYFHLHIALSVVLQNPILLTKPSRRPKDFQWILLFASTKESEIETGKALSFCSSGFQGSYRLPGPISQQWWGSKLALRLANKGVGSAERKRPHGYNILHTTVKKQYFSDVFLSIFISIHCT